MSDIKPIARETVPAIRAGAASLFLLVGLGIGMLLAIATLLLYKEHTTPFAAIVFGSGGIAALIAAFFPNIAMASLPPLAYLGWGLLSGSTLQETTNPSDPSATSTERCMFWLGVVAGCAMLVVLLRR